MGFKLPRKLKNISNEINAEIGLTSGQAIFGDPSKRHGKLSLLGIGERFIRNSKKNAVRGIVKHPGG